ncbi:hypothetical protein NDU88_006172 [Pleurodeles waltl]|uniref:Uncharacterized protein n=1 Tax=Pleurodeles waltl TaxID=8319 RepID=A0AAV7TX15_PLEWA|nr:hypothetical protein NDU88_006172 [Pleurodeles waltl]
MPNPGPQASPRQREQYTAGEKGQRQAPRPQTRTAAPTAGRSGDTTGHSGATIVGQRQAVLATGHSPLGALDGALLGETLVVAFTRQQNAGKHFSVTVARLATRRSNRCCLTERRTPRVYLFFFQGRLSWQQDTPPWARSTERCSPIDFLTRGRLPQQQDAPREHAGRLRSL